MKVPAPLVPAAMASLALGLDLAPVRASGEASHAGVPHHHYLALFQAQVECGDPARLVEWDGRCLSALARAFHPSPLSLQDPPSSSAASQLRTGSESSATSGWPAPPRSGRSPIHPPLALARLDLIPRSSWCPVYARMTPPILADVRRTALAQSATNRRLALARLKEKASAPVPAAFPTPALPGHPLAAASVPLAPPAYEGPGSRPGNSTPPPSVTAKPPEQEPEQEAERGQHWSVLESVDTREKVLALTIDLGESLDPDSLARILDFLEARELHATFFLTGWFIRHYPDRLRQISAQGHDLANHTDKHPDCRQISAQRLREELATVERLLQAHQLRMSFPLLWRPPFGEYNSRVVQTAAHAGYRTVVWSATSLDYDLRTSPDRAARSILRHAEPGGIILCHATRVSCQAIPQVISTLAGEGYRFLTVRDLLAYEDGAKPASPQCLALPGTR